MKRRLLTWVFRYVCRLHSKIQDVLFPRLTPPLSNLSLIRNLDKSDPVFCLSSVDIQARLVPHGAKWGPPGDTISELETYTVHHNLETGEVSGELVLVQFDTDPLDKALSRAGAAEQYDLLFRAVTEYGAFAEQRISQIRFTNWSQTLSIDDIVVEVKVKFCANGMQRWKRSQVDQQKGGESDG